MIRDPRVRRRMAILIAAVAAATQSCGRGDLGTNPTPSIALSVTPGSARVVLGSSVVVTATLTGSAGFKGAGATISLAGAPAGVSFVVTSFQTKGSLTTATITTSVAPTVTPGSYTISVTGSGTNVQPASASFELTVPAPSIFLRLDSASAIVPPGGVVGVGATLVGSDGYMGAGASLEASGAPEGITLVVSNFQTRGSVTTATIVTSVAATVPIGTYTISLIGRGTGVSDVSASFELTVIGVGFTLSVSPATLTMCEGCGNVTATITVQRVSGFTGGVLLSVRSSAVGQGGSFTMAIEPTGTNGNSSILTVSTSAPPGDYTLTIKATAPGAYTQTATIAVTVL